MDTENKSIEGKGADNILLENKDTTLPEEIIIAENNKNDNGIPLVEQVTLETNPVESQKSSNEERQIDNNISSEEEMTILENHVGDSNITLLEEMTLEKALNDAQLAVNLCLDNEFEKAYSIVSPYANTSVYHSLGYSAFLCFEALLTFDREKMLISSDTLRQTLTICNDHRKKKNFFVKLVHKINFLNYTDDEAHAELCHAECILLQSLLTCMEDESLHNFIKAGFKFKSCYNYYKDCHKMLEKEWSKNSNKVHFESGVKFGIGIFNLMISMASTKMIKLLEFVGLSGNRELGLQELNLGSQMEGLRQTFCILLFLTYNLFLLCILSHREGDINKCEDILEQELGKHPKGILILFFKSRLEFVKGNFDESIDWYKKCWKLQDIWPKLHEICFWELTWIYCLKTEWKEAIIYSDYLVKNSQWSRSLCTYLKASIMFTIKEELTSLELQEVEDLMKDVPVHRCRIAGKHLPMETFAIKRAKRFVDQNQSLVLPIIELIFLSNLFKLLKDFKLSSNFLKIIEKSLTDLDSATESSIYDSDNRAVILLLKGACLNRMGFPMQALECLETVISMEKIIVEDTFVIPFAIVELALIEWQSGNKEKAILALKDARKNYNGYSVENRLHFKIHTALVEFKAALNET